MKDFVKNLYFRWYKNLNSLFYNLNIDGIFFGFNNFWISVYLKLFSLKCFDYIIFFIVIYILGNYLECLDDEIYN